MLLEQEKETRRRRARIPLTLPIVITCRESPEYEWTEHSRLVDVTHLGAGFTLSRPIEPGRVIQLTAPLPERLRCFDHNEPQYSVWCLVRHASRIRKLHDKESPLFRLGVAFVGKAAPRAYCDDPTVRYEPSTSDGQNTMWKVIERRTDGKRRENRLLVPIEVLIQVLDENGETSKQEHTVTETMSSLGTCVPTSLDVGIGRTVRIVCPSDQRSIFAVIRSREVAQDGIARLGLEFLGERWPIERS